LVTSCSITWIWVFGGRWMALWYFYLAVPLFRLMWILFIGYIYLCMYLFVNREKLFMLKFVKYPSFNEHFALQCLKHECGPQLFSHTSLIFNIMEPHGFHTEGHHCWSPCAKYPVGNLGKLYPSGWSFKSKRFPLKISHP
jgi:hypothetical protein